MPITHPNQQLSIHAAEISAAKSSFQYPRFFGKHDKGGLRLQITVPMMAQSSARYRYEGNVRVTLLVLSKCDAKRSPGDYHRGERKDTVVNRLVGMQIRIPTLLEISKYGRQAFFLTLALRS